MLGLVWKGKDEIKIIPSGNGFIAYIATMNLNNIADKRQAMAAARIVADIISPDPVIENCQSFLITEMLTRAENVKFHSFFAILGKVVNIFTAIGHGFTQHPMLISGFCGVFYRI